jgi:hypothetical protein
VAVTVGTIDDRRVRIVVADIRRITVAVVVNVVAGDERAAAEVRVRDADAGVEDVDVDADPVTGGLIARVERQRALVDAIEPPAGDALGGRGQGEDAVLFDIQDARVRRQGARRRQGKIRGEAVQGGVVDVSRSPTGQIGRRRRDGERVLVVPQHHDVAPGDGAFHLADANTLLRIRRHTQGEEASSEDESDEREIWRKAKLTPAAAKTNDRNQ